MYLKREELEILKKALEFLYELGEENTEEYKKFENVVSLLEERYNKRNSYNAKYMSSKRVTDRNYARENARKEKYVIDFDNLGI